MPTFHSMTRTLLNRHGSTTADAVKQAEDANAPSADVRSTDLRSKLQRLGQFATLGTWKSEKGQARSGMSEQRTSSKRYP